MFEKVKSKIELMKILIHLFNMVGGFAMNREVVITQKMKLAFDILKKLKNM